MSDLGVSRGDISRAAHNHGFAVSDAQLHRWRSRGLIPRSKVRGLGRGRGTTSFYPKGTSEQVVALCSLLEENRRVDLAALALFFQGFPVSTELLREVLMGAADRWETETVGLTDDTGITPTGVDVLDKMIFRRLKSGPLTRVRGRLRKSKFETFMRILIFVASGRTPEFLENTDGPVAELGVMKKGLGIEMALSTWMKADDDELRSSVNSLVAHFRPAGLRATLQETGENALNASRGELLIIWQTFMDAQACFKVLDEKDALGLGSLPDIDFTHSSPLAPTMLLIWLHLRRMPEIASGIPVVIATATRVSNLRNLIDSRPKLIGPVKAALSLLGALIA